MTETPEFTPALGRPALTGEYDLAIRLMTREKVWRRALLRQVAPQDGEVILDVGCGTGTFAIMMKQVAKGARIIGLDPDPYVLKIAARKANDAGASIEWRKGMARDAAGLAGSADKTVSSLVFHQVPVEEKRTGIAAMIKAVRPGGEVHIADYARQSSWLMRRLFRIVQSVDGRENTQPNADGMLEAIIAEKNRRAATPARIIYTPTGAISLFRWRT